MDAPRSFCPSSAIQIVLPQCGPLKPLGQVDGRPIRNWINLLWMILAIRIAPGMHLSQGWLIFPKATLLTSQVLYGHGIPSAIPSFSVFEWTANPSLPREPLREKEWVEIPGKTPLGISLLTPTGMDLRSSRSSFQGEAVDLKHPISVSHPGPTMGMIFSFFSIILRLNVWLSRWFPTIPSRLQTTWFGGEMRGPKTR